MTTSAYIPDKLTLYGPATPVWNTDLELDTSVFLSGDASIHVLGTSSKAVQVTEEQWPVSPGDVVSVDFVVRQHDRTVGNNLQLYLFWWYSAHGYLSGSTIYNNRLPAIDTWYRISGSDTAPASACYVTAGFYRPAVAFDVWLDEMGARLVQPGFMAYMSSDTAVATGGEYVVFDQTIYNYGNCYNAATGVFTAPKSGRYLVNTTVQIELLDTGQYQYIAPSKISGGVTTRWLYSPIVFAPSDNVSLPTQSNGFMRMERGDTCKIWVHHNHGSDLNASGGDMTAGVFGSSFSMELFD